jgi:hypothetical protein
MFLHPLPLTTIGCPREILAKAMAFKIIHGLSSVMRNNQNISPMSYFNVVEAKQDAEALLAFLWWGTAKGILTQVTQRDIPETPHRNHQ